MTRFEFGDIVLVPFPFTDQSTTKKRPAVVISSPTYNTARPDLIIMAVTSQFRPTNAFGEIVVNQWREAGLLKPSAIKPVITTIEKGLVIRAMGRLSNEDQRALRDAVRVIVG
jgi:mRNA interferase MazF